MVGGYGSRKSSPANTNSALETSLVEDTDYTESLSERTISVCSCGIDGDPSRGTSTSGDSNADNVSSSTRTCTCSKCSTCRSPDLYQPLSTSSSISAITATTCSTYRGYFANANNDVLKEDAIVQRTRRSLTLRSPNHGEDVDTDDDAAAADDEDDNDDDAVAEEEEDPMKQVIVFKQRTRRTRPQGPSSPDHMEFEFASHGGNEATAVPMNVSVITRCSIVPSRSRAKSNNDEKGTKMVDELVEKTIRVHSPCVEPTTRVINNLKTDDDYLTNAISLDCEAQTLRINLQQDVRGMTSNAAFIKGPGLGPAAIDLENRPPLPKLPVKPSSEFSFTTVRSHDTVEYQSTIDMEIEDEQEGSVRPEETGLPIESPLETDADTTPVPGVTGSASMGGRRVGQLPENVEILESPKCLSSIVESRAEDNDVTVNAEEADDEQNPVQRTAERVGERSHENAPKASRSFSESEIDNTITIDVESAEDAQAHEVFTDASLHVLAREGYFPVPSIDSDIADVGLKSPYEEGKKKGHDVPTGASEFHVEKEEQEEAFLSPESLDGAQLYGRREIEPESVGGVADRDACIRSCTTENVVRAQQETFSLLPEQCKSDDEIAVATVGETEEVRDPQHIGPPAVASESVVHEKDDFLSSLAPGAPEIAARPSNVPIVVDIQIDISRPPKPSYPTEKILNLENDAMMLSPTPSEVAISPINVLPVTETGGSEPTVGVISPTVAEQITTLKAKCTRKHVRPTPETTASSEFEPPLVSKEKLPTAAESATTPLKQCLATERRVSVESASFSPENAAERGGINKRSSEDESVTGAAEGRVLGVRDSPQEGFSVTIDTIGLEEGGYSSDKRVIEPMTAAAAPENVLLHKKESLGLETGNLASDSAPLTVETCGAVESQVTCVAPAHLPENVTTRLLSANESAASVQSDRALQDSLPLIPMDEKPFQTVDDRLSAAETVIRVTSYPVEPVSPCDSETADSKLASSFQGHECTSEPPSNAPELLLSRVVKPLEPIRSVDSESVEATTEPPALETNCTLTLEFHAVGRENPLSNDLQSIQGLEEGEEGKEYPLVSMVDNPENAEPSKTNQLTCAPAEHQYSEKDCEEHLQRKDLLINIDIDLRNVEPHSHLKEPFIDGVQEAKAVIEKAEFNEDLPENTRQVFPDESLLPLESRGLLDKNVVGEAVSKSHMRSESVKLTAEESIPSSQALNDSMERKNSESSGLSSESFLKADQERGRDGEIGKIMNAKQSNQLETEIFSNAEAIRDKAVEHRNEDFRGGWRDPLVPSPVQFFLNQDFQGNARDNPLEPHEDVGSTESCNCPFKSPVMDIPVAMEQCLERDYCGCADMNPLTPLAPEILQGIAMFGRDRENALCERQSKEKARLQIRLEGKPTGVKYPHEGSFIQGVASDEVESFDSEAIEPGLQQLLDIDFRGLAADVMDEKLKSRESAGEDSQVISTSRPEDYTMETDIASSVNQALAPPLSLSIDSRPESIDNSLEHIVQPETRQPSGEPERAIEGEVTIGVIDVPAAVPSTISENAESNKEPESASMPSKDDPPVLCVPEQVFSEADSSIASGAAMLRDKGVTLSQDDDALKEAEEQVENVDIECLKEKNYEGGESREPGDETAEANTSTQAEFQPSASEQLAVKPDVSIAVNVVFMVNQSESSAQNHQIYPETIVSVPSEQICPFSSNRDVIGPMGFPEEANSRQEEDEKIEENMTNSEMSAAVAEDVSLTKSSEHLAVSTLAANELPLIEESQNPLADDRTIEAFQTTGAPDNIMHGVSAVASLVSSISSEAISLDNAPSYEDSAVQLGQHSTAEKLGSETIIIVKLENSDSTSQKPPTEDPDYKELEGKAPAPRILFVQEDSSHTPINSAHMSSSERVPSDRTKSRDSVNESLDHLDSRADSTPEGVDTCLEHVGPNETRQPTEELEGAVEVEEVPDVTDEPKGVSPTVSENAERHNEPESVAVSRKVTSLVARTLSEPESSIASVAAILRGSRDADVFNVAEEQSDKIEIENIDLIGAKDTEEPKEIINITIVFDNEIFEILESPQNTLVTSASAIKLSPLEIIEEIEEQQFHDIFPCAEETTQETLVEDETRIITNFEEINTLCAEQIIQNVEEEAIEDEETSEEETEPKITITLDIYIVLSNHTAQQNKPEMIIRSASVISTQETHSPVLENPTASLVSQLGEPRPDHHIEESMVNLKEASRTAYLIPTEEEAVANIAAELPEMSLEFSLLLSYQGKSTDLQHGALDTHGANELPRTRSEEAMFLARSDASRAKGREMRVYTANAISFKRFFPIPTTSGITIEECDDLENEGDSVPAVDLFSGDEDDDVEEEMEDENEMAVSPEISDAECPFMETGVHESHEDLANRNIISSSQTAAPGEDVETRKSIGSIESAIEADNGSVKRSDDYPAVATTSSETSGLTIGTLSKNTSNDRCAADDCSKLGGNVIVSATGTDEHADMHISVDNGCKEDENGNEWLLQVARADGSPCDVTMATDELEADDGVVGANIKTAAAIAVHVSAENNLKLDADGKTDQEPIRNRSGANEAQNEGNRETIKVSVQTDTNAPSEVVIGIANAVTGAETGLVKLTQVAELMGSADTTEGILAQLSDFKFKISTNDAHSDVSNIPLNEADGSTMVESMNHVDGVKDSAQRTESHDVETINCTDIHAASVITAFKSNDTQIRVRTTTQGFPDGPSEVKQRVVIERPSGCATPDLRLEKEGQPVKSIKSTTSVELKKDPRVEIMYTVERNFDPLCEATIASRTDNIASLEKHTSSLNAAPTDLEVKDSSLPQDRKLGDLILLTSVESNELNYQSDQQAPVISDVGKHELSFSDRGKSARESDPRNVEEKAPKTSPVQVVPRLDSNEIECAHESLRCCSQSSECCTCTASTSKETQTHTKALQSIQPAPKKELLSLFTEVLSTKHEVSSNDHEEDSRVNDKSESCVPEESKETITETESHPSHLEEEVEEELSAESVEEISESEDLVEVERVEAHVVSPKNSDAEAVCVDQSVHIKFALKVRATEIEEEEEEEEKGEEEEVEPINAYIPEDVVAMVSLETRETNCEVAFREVSSLSKAKIGSGEGEESVDTVESVEIVEYLEPDDLQQVTPACRQELVIEINITAVLIGPSAVKAVRSTPQFSLGVPEVLIDVCADERIEPTEDVHQPKFGNICTEEAHYASQQVEQITCCGTEEAMENELDRLPSSPCSANPPDNTVNHTSPSISHPLETSQVCRNTCSEEEYSVTPEVEPLPHGVRRGATEKELDFLLASTCPTNTPTPTDNQSTPPVSYPLGTGRVSLQIDPQEGHSVIPQVELIPASGTEEAIEKELDLLMASTCPVTTPDTTAYQESNSFSNPLETGQLCCRYESFKQENEQFLPLITRDSLSVPSLDDENFIVKARARVTTEIVAFVDENGMSVIRNATPRVVINRRRDRSTPPMAVYVNRDSAARSGGRVPGPLPCTRSSPKQPQAPRQRSGSMRQSENVATQNRSTRFLLDLLITDTLTSIKRNGRRPDHHNNHGIIPGARSLIPPRQTSPGNAFSRYSRFGPGNTQRRPSFPNR